jgi:hypothetical protein
VRFGPGKSFHAYPCKAHSLSCTPRLIPKFCPEIAGRTSSTMIFRSIDVASVIGKHGVNEMSEVNKDKILRSACKWLRRSRRRHRSGNTWVGWPNIVSFICDEFELDPIQGQPNGCSVLVAALKAVEGLNVSEQDVWNVCQRLGWYTHNLV